MFDVLWRTAAFRMALWQAALCLLVVMAMLAIVNDRVADYARDDLRSEVAIQMASLRLADSEGTLEAQLRRRVSGAPVGPDYYLLVDFHQILSRAFHRKVSHRLQVQLSSVVG